MINENSNENDDSLINQDLNSSIVDNSKCDNVINNHKCPEKTDQLIPQRKSSRLSEIGPVDYKGELVDYKLYKEPRKIVSRKEKECDQFKEELKSVGVDESIIDEVMKIHKKKPDLAPYECKRLFNIKINKEKLKNLKLTKIKEHKSSKPKRKYEKKKEKIVTLPSRKSSRISEMAPIQYDPDSESDNEVKKIPFKSNLPIKRSKV